MVPTPRLSWSLSLASWPETPALIHHGAGLAYGNERLELARNDGSI
jgi:hypothetical protein